MTQKNFVLLTEDELKAYRRKANEIHCETDLRGELARCLDEIEYLRGLTSRTASDFDVSFLRRVKEKNYAFYFAAQDENGYDVALNDPKADTFYVAFGHTEEGYIDDGWYLEAGEATEDEQDEWEDNVSRLLKHTAIGYEIYSCSYECEKERMDDLRSYLTSLGFKEGKPAW